MSTFQQYNVLPWLTSVRLCSNANVSGTYFNGNSNNGVGATLTISASSLTVDSVTANVGDRILLQNQTSAFQNGIYVVNSIGSVVVLQRSADMQSIEQYKVGQYVSVGAGTALGGSAFILVESLPAVLGVNTQSWVDASSSANITLPTIANHIATYTNTAGALSEDPATAISGGNIQAGLSGTAGSLISFPGTAASGSFALTAANSSGNFAAVLTNASLGQASTWTLADPGAAASKVLQAAGSLVSGNLNQNSGTAGLITDSGVAANKVLTSSIASPDVSIDLVSFDVTVGQAALATGGAVALITSSGSKQYKIRSLQLNSGGTNFSGGGGDRLGQVTDGTTVYSVLPAANMQALTNAQWGATALPNPASAALNTSTVAGANLSFKYSGGTTDYTAGSLVITGIAQRVA